MSNRVLTVAPPRWIPGSTALALAALALASCSATQLAGEWRNPKYAGKTYRRIFVLGVTADPLGRRLFEDSMERRVKAAGSDAVVSYTVLPAGDKLAREDVVARVKESAADLVLVGKVIGRRTEFVQHTTADTMGPYRGRGGWYGYYGGSWDTVHATTSTTAYDVLSLETQLFETASEEIVWLASWETVLDTSREEAVESFTKAVVSSLREHIKASGDS
jgi:hypothetical protein